MLTNHTTKKTGIKFTLILLAALLLWQIQGVAANDDTPENRVAQAWEQVQQSQVYQFDTHIQQTVYPVPALQNVGRAPQTDDIYLSGRRDQAQDLLEMTLWQNVRGSAESGIAVRSQDGRTFRRNAVGDWEEHNDLGDLFAPGGEPLSFLQTAKNVMASGTDTRQIGDLTFTFETYRFDLDSSAYARIMRQQLDAQLAQYGRLPEGITLETPEIYRQITGQGDLWLDEDGFPRRLEMMLEIPPQGESGRVDATLVTDLSGFDRDIVAQMAIPFSESPGAWVQARQPALLTGAKQTGQILIALVGMALLLLGVIRYWRSRRFYATVALVVIFSTVFTPLLESVQAADFMDALRTAQAEAQIRQEETQAQVEVQESLRSNDWNPQQNPLDAQPEVKLPSTSTASTLNQPTAATLNASDSITDTTDTDGDGLIDSDEAYWGTCPYLSAPEGCIGVVDPTDSDGDSLSDGIEVYDLGTDPAMADSDADGIADKEEVSGFAYNGQDWYLNPRETDSNQDGLADGLECRVRASVVADGFDANGICPDTDGDGTPDVYDPDNDGDGVPDSSDMSPFAASADSYDETTPLALSMDNLALDKPVFVDLQIRPSDADNLNLYNHVLDWPSMDTEGQIQRFRDTTFADTDTLDLRSDAANAANGDIRLVPMLEITMPYTDGHYANLPITSTAPASRVVGDAVDTWLDSTQLDPFGISVNDVEDNSGDLNAYLPLTQVTDRFGTPHAFAARMFYRPSQGTVGRAEWGPAHEVRLVWFVQMITDECPDGYDDVREEVDGEMTYSCVNPDTGATAVRQDVLTIGHIYPDTWQLTGLSVSEEHDFDMAILYEDPAQDTDLTSDDQLLVTSWNLSTGFMIGRDCDSKDGNGDCVGDGARDVTVENLATVVPSWFTAVDYLNIETYLDYDHGGYLTYLIGNEVTPLLEEHFSTHTDLIPTFMYVQDHTIRELNLDSLTNNSAAGLVAFSGDSLALDLTPADVPTQVRSSVSWTPYQYVNGNWQAAEIESYLTRLDTRLQEESYFQPDNETEATFEEAADRRLWIQTYYASIWMGLTAWTALADQPLNTRASNPNIPDAEYDPFFTPGTDFGAILLALEAIDYIFGDGGAFLGSTSRMGRAAFTVLVLITWAAIYLMANGNEKLQRIGEIVLASLSLVLGVIYAANALSAIASGGLSAGTKFPAMGGAGLVIVLLATWGILLFTIFTKDMSGLAINTAVSVAIATTLFSIFLVVLSLLGLGILGVLLFLVDAIFVLLGKKGPTAYITEFLAKQLFDVDMSVTNLDSSDRLDVQVHEIGFMDERQGFRVTNSLFVTMGITNSIKYHRDLAGDEERVAKRNVFTYTLQMEQIGYERDLDYWSDTATDQWTPLSGRMLQTSSENSLVLPLADVGAGLNQPMEVYYTESFLTGARSCWNIPTDQGVVKICNWNKFRDAIHYPLSEMLVYDIFPETINQFAKMRWSTTDPALPQQVDPDADGISNLFGADPNRLAFDGDNDGLGDLYEITQGYNANHADGDFDGLTDAEELIWGTNPFLQDTDGDGLNDGIETVEGWLVVYDGNQLTRVWSDPLVVDADEDGLSDLEEFVFGFNPWTATDPSRIANLVQFDNLGVTEAGAPQVLLQFEDAANSAAFFDSSGEGHHATCTGDACPSVVDNGRYAQALQFDGTNDFATIANTDDINLGLHPEHTLAVWFKVDDATINSRKQVIYEQGGFGKGLNLYVFDGQLYGGGWNTPVSESDWAGSYLSATVSSGQWHHAALVLDGQETVSPDALTLYLDGQLVGTADGSQLWEHTGNIGIGAFYGDTRFHDGGVTGDGGYLAGRVDDLVVFNRAVTAAEVTGLMNGRFNPNDNLLTAADKLRYHATITNTSSTTATGFLVAENSTIDPEVPAPTAAFSFESEQRRAYFHSESGQENRPYCFDAVSCPTLGQAGRYGNGLLFDSDEDMLYLPTIDAHAEDSRYQLAFWLRLDSLPAAGERAMILDTASTEPGALDLYIDENGHLVRDIVGDPGGPRVSSYTFTPNQWTHVMLYLSHIYYINGTQAYFSGDYWVADMPIKIGHGRLGNSIDGAAPFRGGIDELVYYEDGRSDRNNEIMNGTYVSSLGSYELLYRFNDGVNYNGTTFYNNYNNGNAVCSGGTCPLLTIEGRGVTGRAVQFDGVDDFAYQYANNTYGTNNPRTFNLYVKPTRYPSPGDIAYLYNASETYTDGSVTAIFNLYMDENGQLTVDYGWGSHTYTTLDPLPLNQWSKIAVTFERLFSPLRYDMTLTLNDGSSNAVDICDKSLNGNCFHEIRMAPGRIGNSMDDTAPYAGLIDSINLAAAVFNFDTSFVDFGYENLASESRTSTCLFRAACPTTTTGQFGDGLTFDGNDFLVVNTPVNPAKTDFSTSLWFKTADFSSEPILLQQEDRDGVGRTWLGLRADGRLYTYLGNSYLNSNVAATANQWHHTAVTYDGATLRLYLDGVLVAEQARAMESNNGAFWVGRPKIGVANGYDRYFAGEMDELVIVPSVLDAAALHLLMNSSWPMIDVPAEFAPFDALALTSQAVSAPAYVTPYAATSTYRFDQKVEAALVLQAQIDYPIIDGNAANLEMYLPFEDGPGTNVFDNLISYPNSFIDPDLEAICASTESCPTAGLRGQVERAAYFDGLDDYLLIDSSAYHSNGPSNVTAVSVWVNAAQGTILDIDRYGSLGDSTLEIELNRIVVKDSGGSPVRTITYDAPRNEWFHLVVTIDSSDQGTVYVNGEVAATGVLERYQTDDDLYTIGANNGGQDFLQGYLDDLRLYSVPLTQADVTALYEISAPLMRFEFDEDDTATRFTDNSTNQYIGRPSTLSQTMDGETVTQPNPAPGTKGRIGNGVLFDGNGNIEVENATVPAALTNDFTIMAWIRPEGDGVGGERIFGAGGEASFDGYNFGLYNGNLLFQTYGIQQYQTGVQVTPDRWQHVAVVFDINNDAHFYLDGAFQQTVTGTSPANANTDDPLFIGARTDGNGDIIQGYTGMIDELALYGRSLTEAELYGIYLRELRWYRDKAVTYLTVDTDTPTIELLSDAAYWPDGYIQLAVATTDATSGVSLLDFGLKAPGESDFTWQGAPRCAESDDNGGAWCPYFDSTQLGGEGVYELQFRAVDAVGNETLSPVYMLYVDGTAPTASGNYTGQWVQPSAQSDANLSWILALSGSLSDPDLATTPAIAGSGVATNTVMVDVVDGFGGRFSDVPQQATVSGNTWSLDYQMRGVRPQGTYTVSLTVADVVGNEAALTLGTLRLDERPPTVDLDDRSLGTAISNTAVLSGTAGDLPDWGDSVVEHYFEEPAGSTLFYNTTNSQFYTSTHSTCTSCPTAGVPALFGNGVQFDGVDDFIDVPFVINPAAQSFAASVWINVTHLDSQRVIVQQLDDNGTGRTWLYILTNGKIQSNLGGVLATTSSITPGEWHHVALTYDGADLRLYLDGRLEASAARTPETTEGDLWLGVNKSGGSPFMGTMDEFALYDRALSDHEIYALAQQDVVGVTSVDVAITPAVFVTDTTTLPTDWVSATVISEGAKKTAWQYTLPTGLEDFYEISARSTDAFGNLGRSYTAWRGLIDTVAPTVVGNGLHVGSGASAWTEYTFTFTDFLLDESSYVQPCGSGSLVSLRYADPVLPYDGLPYQVTAICSVAGHEASRDLTVCDVAGHCTTITVIPRLATELTLTVVTAGAGSGTVSSDPAGIACGVDCTETYPVGTEVTLTAVADAGSIFANWLGACTGTGDCTLTMDATKTVTATFVQIEQKLYLPLVMNAASP